MLNKKYKILIFALFCMINILFAGCAKAPLNGHLDGEWEVMNINPAPPVYGQETRRFFSFQLHVCQLTSYGQWFTHGSLEYDYPHMKLSFPYIDSDWQEKILQQYGIYSNPITFDVKFEGDRFMTLSNEEVTITLKKF